MLEGAIDALATGGRAARNARAEPQLPVTLPGEEELRGAAATVPLVQQLTGLAEWAGQGERELTKLGRLRLGDARELVTALDTGDRPGSPRTGADLPRLNLAFEWAKKARLVRLATGRLYAVAKARPLLKDPLALWQRALRGGLRTAEPLVGDRDGYRPPTRTQYGAPMHWTAQTGSR